MLRVMLCLPLCFLLAPEYPVIAVPDEPRTAAAGSEPLPVADPVEFLHKCVERFDEQGIKGYRCTMHKQERIGGKLQPSEEVEVFFRVQPHSVLLRWVHGQRKADSALYVEGENENKMLAHPSGVAGAFVKVVTRDVDGDDAKQSGRYPLNEFGLKKAVERTYKAWRAARDNGTLRVEYLGVRKLREAGDRPCYVLRRSQDKPDDEGTVQVTIYIDKENWLQVGSVIKGEDNKLIGEYMFRDIQINPKFKANQFEKSALTE